MFRAFRTKSGYDETHRPRRRAAACAGLFAFAVACVLVAWPSKARAASQYDTLEELLPAETVGVLTLPSVDGVQAILDGWYEDFQGLRDEDVTDVPRVVEEIASLIGLDAAQIDPERPLLAALSLAMAGSPPMPSVIIPVFDEDEAMLSLETGASSHFGATHASGRGYIVMTSVPHYTPGVSSFELQAPHDPQDVRVAFDLDALYQMYGPMLEFFLAAMMQQMQSEAADSAALEATTRAADWAQDVLANAERLEINLSTDDELLRMSSTLRSRPGSPPIVPVHDSKRMLELARVLDDDAAMYAVVSADFRELYEWTMNMQQAELDRRLDSAAPEQSDQLMSLLEYSADLQRLLAGPNACSLSFDEKGVRVVHLMQLEEPEGFVQAFREAMSAMKALEPLGLVLSEDPATRLRGVDVHTWRVSFRPDFINVRPRSEEVATIREWGEIHHKLFGGDEGHARLAVVDDIAVLVLHPDETHMDKKLQRMKSRSRKLPASIRKLAERHGGAPWLAAEGDLRRVVAGFVDAVFNPDAVADRDAYDALLQGDPVPMTLSSSQRDGLLHCEFTTDVRALASFFESLREVLPDTKQPSASDG